MDGLGAQVSDLSLAHRYDGSAVAVVPPVDEAQWIEAARRGDLEAFDAIMARYESAILRFLISVVYDVEIARELCQDTFLAAYEALPRSQGEMRLSSWLFTIALNRARSHHRRQRLRRFVPLEDHHHPISRRDVGEALAVHELVQRVLERMPQQYVRPLLLQTVGGLTCREIAEVLGTTEGAVKVRLLRAREAFRQAYGEETA